MLQLSNEMKGMQQQLQKVGDDVAVLHKNLSSSAYMYRMNCAVMQRIIWNCGARYKLWTIQCRKQLR